jgi:hypothetical protein
MPSVYSFPLLEERWQSYVLHKGEI